MLARINRLRKRVDLDKIKREGVLFQSENFGAMVYKRGDNQPPRFGFIVSTKIASKAVDRNRIKRVLSEVVRLNSDKFPNGLDILFLTKRGIFSKTTKEIKSELGLFLAKNKL